MKVTFGLVPLAKNWFSLQPAVKGKTGNFNALDNTNETTFPSKSEKQWILHGAIYKLQFDKTCFVAFMMPFSRLLQYVKIV